MISEKINLETIVICCLGQWFMVLVYMQICDWFVFEKFDWHYKR